MIDLGSLPISGRVLGLGLFWAGLSGFVLGPELAARQVARAGWQSVCEAQAKGAIAAKRPLPPKVLPRTDCAALLGGMMPELNELCFAFGNPDLAGPQGALASKAEDQARARLNAALDAELEQAPDRCACAARVVQADRLSWGLYAGSAGIAGGPKDLMAELRAGLSHPICVREG